MLCLNCKLGLPYPAEGHGSFQAWQLCNWQLSGLGTCHLNSKTSASPQKEVKLWLSRGQNKCLHGSPVCGLVGVGLGPSGTSRKPASSAPRVIFGKDGSSCVWQAGAITKT